MATVAELEANIRAAGCLDDLLGYRGDVVTLLRTVASEGGPDLQPLLDAAEELEVWDLGPEPDEDEDEELFDEWVELGQADLLEVLELTH